MDVSFGQWYLDETAEMEHRKKALRYEEREIERERRNLERREAGIFLQGTCRGTSHGEGKAAFCDEVEDP